jgi:hypothetical protein
MTQLGQFGVEQQYPGSGGFGVKHHRSIKQTNKQTNKQRNYISTVLLYNQVDYGKNDRMYKLLSFLDVSFGGYPVFAP